MSMELRHYTKSTTRFDPPQDSIRELTPLSHTYPPPPPPLTRLGRPTIQTDCKWDQFYQCYPRLHYGVKNGISDINVVVIFQKIGNRKISNDDVILI